MAQDLLVPWRIIGQRLLVCRRRIGLTPRTSDRAAQELRLIALGDESLPTSNGGTFGPIGGRFGAGCQLFRRPLPGHAALPGVPRRAHVAQVAGVAGLSTLARLMRPSMTEFGSGLVRDDPAFGHAVFARSLECRPIVRHRPVERGPLPAALNVTGPIIAALGTVAFAALHPLPAHLAAVGAFVTLGPLETMPLKTLVPLPEPRRLHTRLPGFAAMWPLIPASLVAAFAAHEFALTLPLRKAGYRRLISVRCLIGNVVFGLRLRVRHVRSDPLLRHPARLAARHALLLTVGQNDPIVMLSMLQIILGQHRVAGQLRISGERKILLGNVGRRSADLNFGPVRFEASRKRILPFAMMTTVVLVVASAMTVVAPATAPVLLTLPHRIPFSRSHRIRRGPLPVAPGVANPQPHKPHNTVAKTAPTKTGRSATSEK